MPISRSTAPRKEADRAAPRHTLRVHRLELDVRLGCAAAERSEPQRIELDAVIRFASPLAACRSDSLADTVCYADLAEIARRLTTAREFHLVEYLTQEIFDAFRERIPPEARLAVTVRKVSPPVPGLADGVSFTVEEEE